MSDERETSLNTTQTTEDGDSKESPRRTRKRTKDRGLDGGYWASLNTTATETTTATPAPTTETGRKRRRTAVERLYVDEVASSSILHHRSRSTSTNERHQTHGDNHSLKSSSSASTKLLYKKHAFLAVRNESDGFYLCQSLVNINTNTSRCKIQWLEEERANSNEYTLAYIDHVDQQTIITNVNTKKLDKSVGKSVYSIVEEDLQRVHALLEKAIKEGGIEVELSDSDDNDNDNDNESDKEEKSEKSSSSSSSSSSDTEPIEPPVRKKKPINKDPYLFDEDNSSTASNTTSKKDGDKKEAINTPKASNTTTTANNTKSHLDSVRNKVLQKLQKASVPIQPPIIAKAAPKAHKKTLQTLKESRSKKTIESSSSSDDEENNTTTTTTTTTNNNNNNNNTNKKGDQSSDNELAAPAPKKNKKESPTLPTIKKPSSPKKPKMPTEPQAVTPKPPTKRQMFKVISNRLLEERPQVTVPIKDPFFEDDSAQIAYISPQIQSRLAYRCINTNDTTALKALIADTERVQSLSITTRSHISAQTPLEHAIITENTEAIRILLEEHTRPSTEKRVKMANSMCKKFSTGTYNHYSLPTYRVRALTQSRGVKEGNNALLKDINHPHGAVLDPSVIIRTCLEYGVCEEILTEIAQKLNYQDTLCSLVLHAILFGHRKLAGKIIEEHGSSFGFNTLHSDVLKLDYEELKPNTVRAASCRKKAFDYYSGNDQITPIHCAAINPNVKYLKSLLNITQDFAIGDKSGRRPIHYAAVCEGPMPLEYLLSRCSADEVDSKGLTPLHYACLAGRTLNVEILLRSAVEKHDDESVSSDVLAVANKFGVGGINRPARVVNASPNHVIYSATPLHVAISRGHIDCVKVLLKYGANVEYQMGKDKLTPLMYAAQLGHHKIVALLRENGSARIEARDRYQRTALMHAASVGNTRSLAYFLRMGANPMAFDSSGNTAMHYACAYGWVTCVDELMSVGGAALVNAANEWKMSAFGAAFLKAHVGICDRLIERFPGGVDVNFRTENGETLVMLCAASVPDEGNLAQMSYIVGKLKANVDLVDAKANTALHHLAKNLASNSDEEKVLGEMARVVIDAGCHVDAENNEGETPAHVALKCTNIAFVRFLIDLSRGRLSRSRNGEGRNLMHLLASVDLTKKAFDVLGLMIDRDLEACKEMVGVEDQYKKKPIDYAFDALKSFLMGNQEVPDEFGDFVLDMVEKLGVDVTKAVLGCVDDRCLGVLKRIFDKGCRVDFDAVDEKGASWLHRCVMANQVELVRLLVDKMPIDVVKARMRVDEDKGAFGDTCVHLAVRLGFFELFDELMNALADRLTEGELCEMLGGVSELGENLLHVLAKVPIGKRIGFDVKRLDDLAEFMGDDALRVMVRKCDLRYQRTPLHVALLNRPGVLSDEMNNVDLELYFIERLSADLRAGDKDAREPLHYLFSNVFDGCTIDEIGCKEVAQVDPVELLTVMSGRLSGDGIDCVDAFGFSPLHYAVMRGATICASHLMTLGAKIHSKIGKNTPLSCAIFYAKETIALEMLRQSPKPSLDAFYYEKNVANNDREYEWKPRVCVCKDLQSSGSKKTPLFELIVRNKWQGITWFVLSDLTAYSLRRVDALSAAIHAANYNLALRFLDAFERTGNDALYEELRRDRVRGASLLHVIAQQVPSDGVRKLVVRLVASPLCNKALIEAFDANGATAVHHACSTLNFHFIDALMPIYATCNKEKHLLKLKDLNGNSAFSVLFSNIGKSHYSEDVLKKIEGYYEVVKNAGSEVFLANYACLDAANFNCDPDTAEKTPYPHVVQSAKRLHAFFFAINRQDEAMVRFFIKNIGVDLNMVDADGLTPIMYAIRVNALSIVKLLLNVDWNEESKSDAVKAPLVKKPSVTNGRLRNLFKNVKENGEKSENTVIAENTENGINKDNNSDEEMAIDNENDEDDEENEENSDEENDGDSNEGEDKEIVKVVEDASNEDFTKFEMKSNVNLAHLDSDSRNIFHHMALTLDYGCFVNLNIARLILTCKKSTPIEPNLIKALDSKQMCAFDYASRHGHIALINELNRVLGTPHRLVKLAPVHVADPHYAGPYAIPDYNADAEKLIKVSHVRQSVDEWSQKVDPLSRMSDTGHLAIDDASKVPYDVLMTKTDISYGIFGMHNFYKMQIIVSRDSALFMLFTRWGRIGDEGQYQRTPFASLAEAVVEFSKIFKAKTGNDYAETVLKKSKSFECKIKKYALVSVETRRRNPLADVEFDLVKLLTEKNGTEIAELKLKGDEWFSFFRPLIDAEALKAKSYETTHLAKKYLPLSRLSKKTLVDALALLLNELKPMIERKIEVERERKKENLHEYLKLIETINAKSNEYYQLVPQGGFEFEKLKPVADERKLEEQLSIVQQLIDYQLTMRLLMGAYYSAKSIHPIDYIYQALNCKMCRLTAGDVEAQYIMRYISVSAPQVRVKAIFKVERMGEQERFDRAQLASGESKLVNRHLLWHGTRSENVLSIMCKGLIKAPIDVVSNGCRFGRGIYFSDVFAMACGYSSFGRCSTGADRFVFLCETALGKVQEVVSYGSFEKLADGYDSVKSGARMQPNKQHDVSMPNGCTIPLGNLVTTVAKNGAYYHEQYSQYVVYNEAQVCIRYLVQYYD